MELEQLEAQIKVVATVRGATRATKEMVDKARADWEKENDVILAALVGCNEVVAEEEAKLRELTLQAYAEDPTNKAPAPGVAIKVMTVLSYDLKVALDWAKSHKLALKLDTEAFKKIAKADPPDFVKFTTEPQATIATNLDKV